MKTAKIVSQKEPKVHSPTIEEMRSEIKQLSLFRTYEADGRKKLVFYMKSELKVLLTKIISFFFLC